MSGNTDAAQRVQLLTAKIEDNFVDTSTLILDNCDPERQIESAIGSQPLPLNDTNYLVSLQQSCVEGNVFE